ncbi:MAG: GNAT family N-acetyltransferase [Bacteroidetes bacterium]|nr:GNAT family N-acetyltransferase [Bacteroidota bacterium]
MIEVNFTPFPTLKTSRLILRNVKLSDGPEMQFMRSDERVMRYIDRERAKTIKEAEDFIHLINNLEKENNAVTWAICTPENSKLQGTICLWNFKKPHYRAEVGYALHPDLQGKGLMNEALNAVLDYGFNSLKLHSIEAIVNPANDASIGILQRNNFKQEAYFKENFYFNGKFLDSAVYSLLARDFKLKP